MPDSRAVTSRPLVRLGAIAKDEGPYLVEWIHHHLYFGFDEITVWVNGTTDPSVAILEAVSAVEPRVSFRVVDRLLNESLRKGKNFQYRAYKRIAKRASQEDVTHLALFDLDEYWTPRELTGSIHDFITSDAAVVAFPWAIDVPSREAIPYTPLMRARPGLQLDRHVKSVVALDDRVVQWRTHTARTSTGPRLWVTEPFPFEDEAEQQWGSFVPRDWLSQRDPVLPEAFLVHAMHRSPAEYVASLSRGRRHTGRELPVKNNRHGFAPSGAHMLAFPEVPDATQAYLRSLEEFRTRVGTEDLEREARAQAQRRGEEMIAAAVQDASLLQQLRKPLRHVPVPTLDACKPGWDTTLHWRINTADLSEREKSRSVRGVAAGLVRGHSPLRLTGWAFDEGGREVEFGFRDDRGKEWFDVAVEWVERPDVRSVLPQAPTQPGFVIDAPPRSKVGSGTRLLARTRGEQEWEEWGIPLG